MRTRIAWGSTFWMSIRFPLATTETDCGEGVRRVSNMVSKEPRVVAAMMDTTSHETGVWDHAASRRPFRLSSMAVSTRPFTERSEKKSGGTARRESIALPGSYVALQVEKDAAPAITYGN
jgi:hypothetical protein